MNSAVEKQAIRERNAKSEKTEIHRGKIFRLEREELEFPDLSPAVRDIIRHPGAAAVLPIDSDGNLLLIKQYRRPIGEITIEIPAGTLDQDEDPKVCAIRELREEAGFHAAKLSPLGEIVTAPGFCDERVVLFLAEGLAPDPLPPDDHEVIDLYPIALEDAIKEISDGTIIDAKTIIAIYRYREFIEAK